MPGPYDMQMGGFGQNWLQNVMPLAPMIVNNPEAIASMQATAGNPAPPPLPQQQMPILPQPAGDPSGYVPLEQQTPDFGPPAAPGAQPQISPGQAGLGASRMLGAASGVMSPGFQGVPPISPTSVPVHQGSGTASNPALNQAIMQMMAPKAPGLGPLILGR